MCIGLLVAWNVHLTRTMSAISRILCVDDEPDIRTILTAALNVTMKAEVAAVASASEAFAYLEQNPLPDAIIMDSRMPGMDGLTACKKLRADERFQSVPIIFLTGRARDDGEQAKAMAAGATGCLSKPFDPMSIGDEILRILQQKA